MNPLALSSIATASAARCRSRSLTNASPVRLLKLIAVFGCGGTERQVVNLARMINRSRFDLRFACLKRWGHFLKEIEERRFPVGEYPIDRLYGFGTLRQQARLARDMRRDGIRIFHSYNFYGNVFGIPAARIAGVPVTIASIRDRGVYLTAAQKQVQKQFCRLADCVLVNADSIREWLLDEGYRPQTIAVIRNGIDLSRFERKAGGTRLRRELGVPAAAPLVVMLSRLNPQKGIEYFLEAAGEVSRRCPQARFLVVGDAFVGRNGQVLRDTAYLEQLKHHAMRLGLGGRVIFTGFRDDVPDLLSEAAVSVLPSLSEGLSNSLLESMAAGVPVVATRVGGNPEVVDDGMTGFLVPARDAGALAGATARILQDRALARRLGAEARRQATIGFSLDRMVRDTQDLYLRLLEQKCK